MEIEVINKMESILRKWDGETAHFINQGTWSTEIPTNLSSEKEEVSNFGKEYMDNLFEKREDENAI